MILILQRKIYLLKIIFQFIIIIENLSLVLNKTVTKKLYIKTNGNINEMIIRDYLNNIKENINIINNENIVKIDIDAQYGENIFIKISKKNDINISVGILLQIENLFFDMNNNNFQVIFNETMLCNGNVDINIYETYTKNIVYCYMENNNKNEVEIIINIPFNKYDVDCYETCSDCNYIGNADNHYCLSCNNTKGYYFKENDIKKNCYNNNTIGLGYYLDKNNQIFKKCHTRCSACNKEGTNSASNCQKCNNANNYHFDPIKENHCIKFNELPNTNYYLDTNEDKYQLCHKTCLTCSGPNNDNCISCNGKTLFHVEYYENKCLNLSEIPNNYYSVYNSGIYTYYKCHISCKTCLIGGINNCQECNILDGYYPIEDKEGICLTEDEIPDKYYLDRNNSIINKCHPNCDSCSFGFDNITKEMNCDTCKSGTYFQNISSTNCIPKPETKYYISLYENKETLFPCHKNCLTCNRGGDDINNECLSCEKDLYFDDEITTNCLDDDKECAIGCAKCLKNKTTTNYGIVSADKMCKRCSHKMGYYPLEKYSPDQFYVYCYPYNNPPKNYIFDEVQKIHKLCYKTCDKCFKIGDDFNHSCISCDTNYIFIDEEPNNCFPECLHYYYYNKYNQYKCTETDECPLEYPYLIENKTKCVDNCYTEKTYNLLFKNECFEKCPEGTSAYLYKYNGEYTAKCVNSDDILEENECKLDIKNNNQLEYDKITEELLNQYAEDYVREYPIANAYVTSYSSSMDSLNKYLIVLYKLEKCPKQKVEGYISIGLDECIDKIKTKYTIIQNIVVEIFYIIRKNAPPQINYFLYHPDTGKKLDLSICSGAKLAIKTSIFDNGEVDEELVKYFTNLNINLFDINDPFFTDICFVYSKDGKDVPLDDRIQLYYQNVSLCEDGCNYVGINLESFEVECSCEVHNSETNANIDIAKSLLDNPLSNEMFGIITNSNLEVLKCIKKAFNIHLIFKNYGGLMMIGIYLVQIIITFFIKYQNKQVRNFIYTLINEFNFPPKRKANKIADFQKMNNLRNNNINETKHRQSKDIIIYNSSVDAMNENKNNKNIKKNNETKFNEINIKNKLKYQSIKQGSLNSITTFGEKQKYTYVKMGSIPYSTQYSNSTARGRNNKSNFSYENNNTVLNNSRGSNGSGSGNWNSGFMIYSGSGASELDLKKLDEILEKSDNDYDVDKYNETNISNRQNGITLKRPFFYERKGVGTYIGEEYFKNNSSSYFEQENIYKDINENNNTINIDNETEKKIGIDNCVDKNKNNNIPINDILSNIGNKNITVYNIDGKDNKTNISKREKERKLDIDLDIMNTNSKNKLENNDRMTKIMKLKRKLRKEIIKELKDLRKDKKEFEKRQKEIYVSYEHKEYNEKEMNELDYEEAIIYDKRNFLQMFWYTLKQKQNIINTFCSKDKLKPFSTKLLVMIFSFSCYFVINGFLYNEEYVSSKLKSEESKTIYEYLSDSIERILYTSIVGGVISFIIGILFNTDKKIENVINKNKDNKIILKGEIAKIFRCNNIRILCFIISQFIIMTLFTIYIFCFCYVYPNNKLDWFESSLIVIAIMESISLFNSFLISFIKYLSIKFQWELCFKINAYLEDNL